MSSVEMFRRLGLCLVFSLLLSVAWAAEPVMRVVKSDQARSNLLRNSGFESLENGKFSDWRPAPNGLAVADGEGHSGSRALSCSNANGTEWFGASQSLVLNRTNAAPLVISGWSKAENVSGSSDSDYSLYVDLIYTDGTQLWGQTANFHTGTHDWERRELVIIPEKPVKSLTLHCLLLKHSGKAWFDDVTLEEITDRDGTLLFQGQPVALSSRPSEKKGKRTVLTTSDGLRMTLQGGSVASLRVARQELATDSPSGFMARDVAADSDVHAFNDGLCQDLGLKLQADYKAERDHIVVQGRVSDTRGKDRAVTLFFALPINAAGWRWGDDIRRSRVVGGRGEFANSVAIGCGATGTESLYPLAPIYNDRVGIAMALDMAQPAQYRLFYHAGIKQLLIAFDFGLVPETQQFPGGAGFRFIIFHFDPRWGFRAAFEKYTQAFPDYFRVHSRDQGIWMPFTDISKVQDWQDFGFKYHEGNNNVPWDDAHNVSSFRYTEPMTWWMRMRKGVPRTFADGIRARDELAKGPDVHQRQMADVSRIAGMADESGQPGLMFRNEPWCDGAVWSLNPNPALPTGPEASPAAEAPGGSERFNAATLYWNETTKQSLYGPKAKGHLDGEYLDSIEGYVTADLNFRRDHFRYSTVPLTFASDTKQPALYKGLAVFEFTKWLSEDVHRLGGLMFANGVPYRFTYLCPWLDVLGTETDWLFQGQYRPAPDTRMSLWRTMSGQKPYLLLMNTDYNAFTSELVRRYFQRSLFYGMYPSMFSHNAADNPYWQNPKWYNRDRALFKTYIPLVKRVAEAGWQPVTYAQCDNEQVFVERFGPDQHGTVYITLLNDSSINQKTVLRVDKAKLHLAKGITAREMISESSVASQPSGVEIELAPQESKVIELQSRR